MLRRILWLLALILSFGLISPHGLAVAKDDKKSSKKSTKKSSSKSSKKSSSKKTPKKSTKKSSSKKSSRKKSGKPVYFSPYGGASQAIAGAIDDAKKSIDIAIYSISTEGRIVKALRAALKRKVRIRMVLHKGTTTNLETAKTFAKMGIKVYAVGKTMHHKFAVIDGKTLLNGSGNWSLAADTKFNEALIPFYSAPSLTRSFKREFRLLLGRARSIDAKGKIGDKPDEYAEPIKSKRQGGVYFSSHNEKGSYVIADQIIKAARGAKKSIKIMVAHFNSDRITKALVAIAKKQKKKAKKNRVEIQVLLDRAEYDDPKSQSLVLEKAGMDVRYKVYSMGFYFPRAQLMHHKTIIVDDSLMVTGSYNWSDTAEHGNYENVLVIDSKQSKERKAIVAAFVKEYSRLWTLNRKYIDDFKDAVLSKKGQKGYKTAIPIHFDRPYWNKVMTMNRKELKPIMAVYEKAGLKGKESEDYLSKSTKKALRYVRGKLVGSSKKTTKKPAKKSSSKKSSQSKKSTKK